MLATSSTDLNWHDRLEEMQSDAFERSLKAFSRRVPFVPFTVELVSGSRLAVNHPEAVAFNGGLAVYISPNGTPSLFDAESVSQLVRDNGSRPGGRKRISR